MATTLRGSVGLNGNNWYTDISTIQDMLNQIAVIYGGAAPPFFTFGNYSQQLIDAIRNFQRMNGLYCDGRVDVNGASFKKMLTLLNKPIPPDGPGHTATNTVVPTPPPRPVVKLDSAFRGYRISNWSFVTSAGFGGGVWKIGVNGGYMDFTNPVSEDAGRLYYAGGGGSISWMPASVQWSTSNMPSRGWSNVLLSNRVRGEGTLSDFEGLGGMITGGFVGGPVGYSVTIFLMGASALLTPSAILAAMVPGVTQMVCLSTIADAIIVVGGYSYGSLDLGIGIQSGFFY
jgi:hypothetical protein